jgi:hypothetical protein
MSLQRSAVQIHPAQHAVLTLRLTHKHRFGILRPAKSKFLSFNAIAVALHNKMTTAEFSQTDLAYAPPFGPVWDPLLTAANQLVKKI